jgi:hypothetical protein
MFSEKQREEKRREEEALQEKRRLARLEDDAGRFLRGEPLTGCYEVPSQPVFTRFQVWRNFLDREPERARVLVSGFPDNSPVHDVVRVDNRNRSGRAQIIILGEQDCRPEQAPVLIKYLELVLSRGTRVVSGVNCDNVTVRKILNDTVSKWIESDDGVWFAFRDTPLRDDLVKPVSIVLWKWQKTGSTYYGSVHVNRVFLMIQRYVTVPHEVVCITDDPSGLHWGVRSIPLWREFSDLPGCYRRLRLFSNEMRNLLSERVVSMDLDTVITGNIDHVLLDTTPFRIWQSKTVAGNPYNGSLISMLVGSRESVYKNFDRERSIDAVTRSGMVGSDQCWIAIHLGENEEVFNDSWGVYNFKRDCRKYLKPDARLVFFPGNRKPDNPQVQRLCPWVREHYNIPIA